MADSRHEMKRKREEYEKDAVINLGMGQTLSQLKQDPQQATESTLQEPAPSSARDGQVSAPRGGEEDEAGWETVDRGSKRRKKVDGNYPAIVHSANARLHSFVKISDLQSLVLYLLADGNAPQWVSVRHHNSFEKVVVLMVPGLEADLFTGDIPLEEEKSLEGLGQDGAVIGSSEVSTEHADADKAAREGVVHFHPSKAPQKMHLTPDDYYPSKLASQKLPDPLKPLVDIFPHIWPVKTPGDYTRMHSPLYAMLNSPIPRLKEDKNKKGAKPPAEGRSWQDKRIPMIEFVATREELTENGYAIHPAHLHSDAEREYEGARRRKACQSPEDGWQDILDIQSLSEGAAHETDIEAGGILQGRTLLVIDCEMVTTSTDRFALARVTLIDWDGKTILDELVKPPDVVQDYLTPYSGITKELLDTATLSLKDIQEKFKEILTPQTVLAGHSLDSDFRALKMSYPFVIDTTLLYPHPKGPPQKSSLKWLSQKYLSRDIQHHGAKGHDSVEDALACLDLVKQKCEKGKTWGTPDATGEPIFKRLARIGSDHEIANSSSTNGTPSLDPKNGPGKIGAVVDWGDPKRGFGAAATATVGCESDADVVAGISRAVNGDPNSNNPEDIPAKGCDFVWGRLRELEALRGWWNRSKTEDGQDRLARVLKSGSTNGRSEEQSSIKTDADVSTEASTSTPAPPTPAPTPSAAYPTTPTTQPVLSPTQLSTALSQTITSIQQIYDSLPPKTAFIVYSGSGDPRELVRLQGMHTAFKREYNTKKWDELSVKWTDVEEQALRKAAGRARAGLALIGVK